MDNAVSQEVTTLKAADNAWQAGIRILRLFRISIL